MKQFLCLGSCLAVIALAASGCAMLSAIPGPDPENPISFHEEAHPSDNPGVIRTVNVPGTGLRIPINTFPALTERDLIEARYVESVGGPSIELQFDDHGTIVLDSVTTRGRDRYLVVCIDHKPVMAWYITKRITNGKYVLFGYLSEAAAKQYVAVWGKQIKKNLAR
jgi:hypothetical protein